MKIWKHFSLVLTAAAAALLISACTKGGTEAEPATAPTAENGDLVFEPELFEHEAEPADEQFTAKFSVRNDSLEPVRILKLDTTCTCLSVEADNSVIQPGKATTITAVFDISKLSGESEKSVLVETDHPEVPRKRLGVRVSVPPIVELSPTIVEWSVGEKPGPREILFKVLRDEPIRILEARSSRRQVALEMKTVEEGREYRLILTPESTENILLGFVAITTDCELEQHQKQMAYFAVKEPNE